jgi:hypothetical protein
VQRRRVRDADAVTAIRESVPHVVLEHKRDVRHTIGCPMRQSGGVSGTVRAQWADKRQVLARKTRLPAASQASLCATTVAKARGVPT